MISLWLASAFFVAIHLLISGTRLRVLLVGRIGLQPYLGLFSLLSLVGIVWMSMSYARAPYTELWSPPGWLAHSALYLVLVAYFFVVVGLTTPTPTSVGTESLLDKEEPAVGILRITRHPFLMGVALWAAIHLAVNGDVASFSFFGTLLVVAALGPLAIDHKRARDYPESWPRFREATSILPFVAIVRGRNRFVADELGWWRLLLAAATYMLGLGLHERIFGVSPFPS
jgi:uncharacterized membrane protein